MGIRHKILCDVPINAGGEEFRCDSSGRLVPDPSPGLAAKLVMLANYETVADPEPVAAKPAKASRKKKAAPKKETQED